MKKITMFLCAVGIAASVNAQSPSCTTVSNTLGTTQFSFTPISPLSAYYFDVVADHPIVINDLSLSAQSPSFINGAKYSVYSTDDSYVGKTQNLNEWTYEGEFTGSGTVAALGLNMRHFLYPGESKGFAIVSQLGTTRAIHVSAITVSGRFFSIDVPTSEAITASNADVTVEGAKAGVFGFVLNAVDDRNPKGDLCYTRCETENSFTLFGMNAGWVNAGANNPNVFYYGLVNTKKIRANTTGGVGPYTYAWSSSSGTVLTRTYYPDNTVDFKEPTAPSYVYVTITDEGNGCIMKDSVFVDWSDEFYCYNVGNTPYFKVCIDGIDDCVPWNKDNRDSIFNGNYILGSCGNLTPRKTETAVNTAFTIYPNPSNGVFHANFGVDEKSSARLEVLDIQGRMLMSTEINDASGLVNYTFDLSNYANGMYIVRLVTSTEVQTEKVQLLR